MSNSTTVTTPVVPQGPSTSTSFITSSGPLITSTNVPSTTVQTTISTTPSSSSQFTSSSSFSPPPSQSSAPATSQTPTVVISTSLTTRPASIDGSTSVPPTTLVITSTQTPAVFPSGPTSSSSTESKSSSTSADPASLPTAGSTANNAGGLAPAAKIAVAVVVPIAVVALLVLAGLFFWRKRKQRKDAEELRRKEVEEYGFNPNNDPTLPVIGVASSNGDEPGEMRETDGAGYRGWGTTPATRQPSTTLSGGIGAIGIARSGSGSDPGYHTGSPTALTSDEQSEDPLVGSPNGRPTTADSETIGALGVAPTATGNRQDRDIKRGPSNASSAYSGAHRSDTSGEAAIPGGASGQQYFNDGYYDEGMPQHGPYGDGSYGGGQPVIRDVQARRNTRIENPTVVPQQGNAGIAQNF